VDDAKAKEESEQLRPLFRPLRACLSAVGSDMESTRDFHLVSSDRMASHMPWPGFWHAEQ
jgi:hypothetical protein